MSSPSRCACGRLKAVNDRHRACHRCRYKPDRSYLVTLTRTCATREDAERVAGLLRQVLEARVDIRSA